MEAITKRLPVLAFVLAAFAAFAFNMPTHNATMYWTPDPLSPNGYRDVTEQYLDGQTDCDSDDEAICIVQFPDDDPTQTPVVEENGNYSGN